MADESGHNGSVAPSFSERSLAELAVGRQRFERAERNRRCNNGRLIRRRRRERQAAHCVVRLVAGRSLRSIRGSTVARRAAGRTTGASTARASIAAATAATVPRPPTAATGQARQHRRQRKHCDETFHDGGIPFREDSKSGSHSLTRQRIGSKEGEGNFRRG